MNWNTYINEEWKTIEEYPKYEASANGKIRNKETHIVLKPRTILKGYTCVVLYDDKHKPVSIRIHRIIAKLFVPNPNNYEYVDHINSNKKDNKASNLRWCTHSQNCTFRNGRKVQLLNEKGDIIEEFDNIHIAAKQLNIPYSSLYYGITNKLHSYNKYRLL